MPSPSSQSQIRPSAIRGVDVRLVELLARGVRLQPARLLGRVGVEGPEPRERQPRVRRYGDPGPAVRRHPRLDQPLEHVQPGVLVHPRPAAGAPGQLGGQRPGGGQRAVQPRSPPRRARPARRPPGARRRRASAARRAGTARTARSASRRRPARRSPRRSRSATSAGAPAPARPPRPRRPPARSRVATTVLSTGSASSRPPARTRKSRGSSVNSSANFTGATLAAPSRRPHARPTLRVSRARTPACWGGPNR